MILASILVVDSDSVSRAEIADGLRDLGHDVSETSDAGSALAAMRMKKPDLMVCDCSLPDLTGVELLSDLRGSDDSRTNYTLDRFSAPKAGVVAIVATCHPTSTAHREYGSLRRAKRGQAEGPSCRARQLKQAHAGDMVYTCISSHQSGIFSPND